MWAVSVGAEEILTSWMTVIGWATLLTAFSLEVLECDGGLPTLPRPKTLTARFPGGRPLFRTLAPSAGGAA